MSEIIPHKLYLGSIDDAINVIWLKSVGITDVLTVATDCDEYADVLVGTNITHHVYKAYDISSQNLSNAFPELFTIIDSAKTILVHCMMGISRSATVVLGYMMYSQKMYLDEATRHVLMSRCFIFPNNGFITQLINYEKVLRGCMSFLPNDDGMRKYKRLLHGYD